MFQQKTLVKALLISILLCAAPALADLPVHCRKDQIVGKWQVELTDVFVRGDEYNTCGHNQPDKKSTSFSAMMNTFQKAKSFNMELSMDNTVKDDSQTAGKWTMVYDEGFDITLGKFTYFAFSKYQHSNNKYESICSETLIGWYNNLETGDKGCMRAKKVGADNEATDSLDMVSVVQPKDTQTDEAVDYVENDPLEDAMEKAQQADNEMEESFSDSNDDEIVAEKQKSHKKKSHQNEDYYNFDDVSEYNSDDDFISESPVINQYSLGNDDDSAWFESFAQISEQQTAGEHKKMDSGKKFKAIEETDESEYIQLHHDFKDHEKVVNRLNKVQKDWVAAVPVDFLERDIKSMNKYAGRRKYGYRANPDAAAQGHSASNTFTSFVEQKQNDDDADDGNSEDNKKWENFSRVDVSDLPASFSAKEFINAPIQQKDCGSCYAIATMEMLSARLKKAGENVFLSVQHSLDCNYYNQGCDGGYGYLVNKFFTENELVSENCSPYTGEDGVCGTCDPKKQSKTYKVKDFKFIGGAYGKTTEREMMEEIMNHGPIVVSFEPAYDFMYYSSGVYHSVDAEDWILKGEQQPDWEKVDHSVLCYGWGVTDDGKKYWNLLNSWGKSWGEDGHFRMRRGTDESHIESMGEAAYPYIVNKGSSFVQTEEPVFLGLNEQSSNKNKMF